MDLLSAARDGDLDQIISCLNAGSNINGMDESENTALMWASKKGYDEIVDYLIQSGSDVNHQNTNKTTVTDTILLFEQI